MVEPNGKAASSVVSPEDPAGGVVKQSGRADVDERGYGGSTVRTPVGVPCDPRQAEQETEQATNNNTNKTVTCFTHLTQYAYRTPERLNIYIYIVSRTSL